MNHSAKMNLYIKLSQTQEVTAFLPRRRCAKIVLSVRRRGYICRRQAVKSALRAAATGLLRHVPVPVWRRLFPKSAVGLSYHIISDAEVRHVLHYPFLGYRSV